MNWFGLNKKSDNTALPTASENIGDVFYTDNKEHSIFKSYIPEFLYKPPFGYPRKENLPLIRQLAKNPYIYAVIKTLCDEVASAGREVCYKKGIESTPELDELKEKIDKFFCNPNKNKESFNHLLRALTKDILEVDAGVWIKVFNKRKEFTQLFARDGASYLQNPDIYGYLGDRTDIVQPLNINYAVTPDDPNYAQTLKQYSLSFKDQAAYFQYGWTAAALPVPFGRREVIYMMQNPRSDSVYGLSPIQILADIIMTLVYGSNYNLDFYMNNNMPEGILTVLGANDTSIKALRERLDKSGRVQDSNTGFWRKINFKIPITNQPVDFKAFQLDPKTMQIIEQQSWFSKLVWSCYDDETEILTETGWKLFEDLNDSEKVARVNPETFEIDFVKPLDKQTYHYQGDLISFQSRNCDLRVTPEHKMLYKTKSQHQTKNKKWNVSEASELIDKTIILPQAGIFKGEEIDFMEFKSELKTSWGKTRTVTFKLTGDDFVSFMGFWLGDGWVETDNNRICLTASTVYPENIKFIENLLKRIAPDYKLNISESNSVVQGKKVNVNGKMHIFRFSNKALADYLRQFGKAHDKFVPEIIKKASLKQRQLFVDGYELADGCSARKGYNKRFGSVSKQLLDDVQEILVTSGISANLTINKSNGCYNLSERKCVDKNKIKNYCYLDKTNISKEYYEGNVYDVTVPKHHFLVVRRNGRVSVSGNCFGVSADMLGFTEDSNRATGQNQYTAYKRKAVRPLLEIIKYHIDMEIIPEFGELAYESFEFKWDDYDIDEDKKKHDIWEQQIRMGVTTPEMIADELGIDFTKVKEYNDEKEAKEMEKFDKENSFGNGTPFNNKPNNNNDNNKPDTKLEPKTEKKSFDNELEEELVTQLKKSTKVLLNSLDQDKPLDKIK